jgi:hypothetical protein
MMVNSIPEYMDEEIRSHTYLMRLESIHIFVGHIYRCWSCTCRLAAATVQSVPITAAQDGQNSELADDSVHVLCYGPM